MANLIASFLGTKHMWSLMAETEHTGNTAPKCIWPITEKHANGGTSTRPCGNQAKVWTTKKLGHPDRNICDQHINEAIKGWSWDSIEPCGTNK